MKHILVFNGYPRSGKTTIEKMIADIAPSLIVSSIDPVKYVVHSISCSDVIKDAVILSHLNRYGLGATEKTPKYRRLLSDTKKLLDEFCDFSTQHLLKTIKTFHSPKLQDISFLMIDIREPENIRRLKEELEKTSFFKEKRCDFHTVLVTRNGVSQCSASNDSDRFVLDYPYDFLIQNNEDLNVLRNKTVPDFLSHFN